MNFTIHFDAYAKCRRDLSFFVSLYPTRHKVIFLITTFCQHAFSEWRHRRKNENLGSVMDYAKGKYDDQFVEDIKALQGVVYVFLPVPVFWSLFDQQVRQSTIIMLQLQVTNKKLSKNKRVHLGLSKPHA